MTLTVQFTLELIRMLAGIKASARGLGYFQEGAGRSGQPSRKRGTTIFPLLFMLPSTRG